jgi:hypothetical protein
MSGAIGHWGGQAGDLDAAIFRGGCRWRVKLNDARNLCIFATGDPRNGQWVRERMAFSK